MFLHLLRHAHAGDGIAWDGPDATRPLTDKGIAQSKRLGRFLVERRFATDRILTSPLLRARQTADIVAEHLGLPVVVDERLGGPLDLPSLEAILGDHHDPLQPVIVGHDPDFSELVAILCGAAGVPMRKGAFARLEVDRPLVAGAGTLRWLIAPDLLRPER
ncbi:MAG: histidine phosphatase family protein [Candidatus Limnocylindrales bacterium]